jgi:hypothetical protein
MNPNYIMILTHDEEFVDYGYISGLEMVQSQWSNGWFPSLQLLTMGGEQLEGYKYMIRPVTPNLQLEYIEQCQLDL